MLKYLTTLWFIATAAARHLGRLRFAWIIGFGIAARISLLAAFLLAVQLAVHILKQNLHLPYPLSAITLHPDVVMPLVLIAVPILFGMSGWSMYYAQKMAWDFFIDFSYETRRCNVRATTPTLLVEPLAERRKQVQAFASRDEPEIGRAAHSLISGLTNLLQYVVLSVSILGVLAMVNWKILVVVLALSAAVVPRYVKNSYIWFLEEKKRGVEIGKVRREEQLSIIKGRGVAEADPLLIEEDLLAMLNSETTRSETRQVQQRQLTPRRMLPFLYGSFGIVVAILLFETSHLDASEKARAVAEFVTTMMLLRFLVGEVAASLSALREINTGYPLAEKIRQVLER